MAQLRRQVRRAAHFGVPSKKVAAKGTEMHGVFRPMMRTMIQVRTKRARAYGKTMRMSGQMRHWLSGELLTEIFLIGIEFRPMIAYKDERFVCRDCAHTVRPGVPDYECICRNCSEIANETRRSFASGASHRAA